MSSPCQSVKRPARVVTTLAAALLATSALTAAFARAQPAPASPPEDPARPPQTEPLPEPPPPPPPSAPRPPEDDAPAPEPPALAPVAEAAAVADDPLLHGPYPFLLDNDLALDGGLGLANGWSGVRISASYGYSLAGSLWLALQLDTVAGDREPAPADCTACGKVRTFFDVLAGLKYKLVTPIPLVPYASVLTGPVFLFHRQAPGAMGIAVRGAVGARYFLYEWFGLGLEIGGMLGAAAVDETAGLDSHLRMLDINLGAQVSF